MASEMKDQKSVDLIAEGIAQDVVSRYGQSAERMVTDYADEALTEDDIIDALYGLSDASLDRIAEEGIREAVRAGRGDEFSDLQEAGEIPDGAVWRRSSVLEPSTCDACEEADGEEIDGPDDDLSEICAGGMACRCIPYMDLTEGAGAEE
jgi:hypothetical protein